ncbi:MAG: hypothetical protein ACI9TV_001447 [Sulfurimonas sp.]|jgi:hypothetical protein|uniref:hypothetical protein n=1 Tax=Sulfurimonas sp. TaxID=2022749 RepID=UPI0039E32570
MKKNTLKNLMKEHSSSLSESKMTQEIIENLINTSKDIQVLEKEKGHILFKYLGTKMALLSDENYNRMRIISPITKYSSLATKIKDSLMDSNFHLALDARYAVSEDILYAAFLHPLSSLVTEDFESALKQVYNLAISFGKTYSSAQIEFTKKK